MQVDLPKGKGNGKSKDKGNGPNGGKGLCFNCGEAGHFASNCGKPRKDNNGKGAGKGAGKKGQGMNQFAEALKAVGLQMPPSDGSNQNGGTIDMIRPMCAITTERNNGNSDSWLSSSVNPVPPGSGDPSSEAVDDEFPDVAASWSEPKGAMKARAPKHAEATRIKRVPLSVFLQMNIDDEPNDANIGEDNESMCSTIGGNEQFWLPDNNPRRKKFIHEWNARCNPKHQRSVKFVDKRPRKSDSDSGSGGAVPFG